MGRKESRYGGDGVRRILNFLFRFLKMSVNIDCVDENDENDESQNTNDLKAPGTPEIVGTKGMRTYVPQSNSRVNAYR